ncbi:hypothetical protein VNO77_22576 [Canavalia gladiata]|uniref:Uncharacterized protein n=1 Tax=Canavalia gladiata TaxID=3824 RepID=A0AAN9L3B6_CANGL
MGIKFRIVGPLSQFQTTYFCAELSVPMSSIRVIPLTQHPEALKTCTLPVLTDLCSCYPQIGSIRRETGYTKDDHAIIALYI